MKQLLASSGARLLDNVVLTDNAHTLATLVTTPLWVLTGNRQALPFLPPAGVAANDIEHAIRFGRALCDALHDGRERQNAPLLSGLRAVTVNPKLLVSEKAATRSFFIWGHILHAAGQPGSLQRVPLLAIYSLFLVVMVATVVPLSLLLQAILGPLLAARLAKAKHLFEQPSGSESDRMSRYDF